MTVSDTGSGPNGFKLTGVTSNQADSGLGADDVPNDIQNWATGTADTSGAVRAERFSNARTYTLSYQGFDVAGNSAVCTATVTVPRNQK